MKTEVLIIAGLIGALMYGIEAFILKHTLNTSPKGGSVYGLYAGIVHLAIGCILVVGLQKAIFIDIKLVGLLLAAGGLLGLSYYGYYYLMNKDSASNVLQLASLESVTTPLAGIFILGESFTVSSGIGVGLIVVGIIVLSIDRGVLRNLTKAVIPMLVILLLWSIDDVFLKQSLEQTGFIIAYFWSRLGLVIVLLGYPNQVSKLQTIVTYHSRQEHALYIFALVCSSIAIYLTLYTYANLPLSIANPIISTYPIMLLGVMYIARKFNMAEIEPTTNLWKRFSASILFLSGIYILTTAV